MARSRHDKREAVGPWPSCSEAVALHFDLYTFHGPFVMPGGHLSLLPPPILPVSICYQHRQGVLAYSLATWCIPYGWMLIGIGIGNKYREKNPLMKPRNGTCWSVFWCNMKHWCKLWRDPPKLVLRTGRNLQSQNPDASPAHSCSCQNIISIVSF